MTTDFVPFPLWKGGLRKGEVFTVSAGAGGKSTFGKLSASVEDETPEQRAKRIGVPFIKPAVFPIRRDLSPNPVIAVCGGCGRNVHRIEGYSCPNGNCPIQPKPFFGTSTETC